MTASEIRPHLLSEIFKEYFLILRNVTFVNASDFIEKIKNDLKKPKLKMLR